MALLSASGKPEDNCTGAAGLPYKTVILKINEQLEAQISCVQLFVDTV